MVAGKLPTPADSSNRAGLAATDDGLSKLGRAGSNPRRSDVRRPCDPRWAPPRGRRSLVDLTRTRRAPGYGSCHTEGGRRPVSGRASGSWQAERWGQSLRHWTSESASALAFGRPWRVLPCGLVESTSAAVLVAAAPMSAKGLSSGACHWLSSGPALIGTRPDSFVLFMPAPASQRPAPRPHRALQDAEVSEAGSCPHRGPTTGARPAAAAGGSRAHRPAPAAPPGSPRLPVAAPAAPG